MIWAPGITQIRWATSSDPIGKSPAAVYRRSGVVVLNPAFADKLNADQWLFILLHEAGHLALQSQDEKAVDEWAFAQYAALGKSLKSAVQSLTRGLPFTNAEQLERANLQFIRALEHQKKFPTPTRTAPPPPPMYPAQMYAVGQLAASNEMESWFGRRLFAKARSTVDRAASFGPIGVVNRFRNRLTDKALHGVTDLYRNRRRLANLAKYTPQGFVAGAAWRNRGRFGIHFDGSDQMDGYTGDVNAFQRRAMSPALDGFASGEMESWFGRRFFDKVGQGAKNFGKFTAKQAVKYAPAAAGAIPIFGGLAGGIVGDLLQKGDTQGAAQEAQTPAESRAVVAAAAPSLTGADLIKAMQAVQSANKPQEATLVVAELQRREAEAKAKAAQTKNYLFIGGGVLAVVVILILALRKK